MWTSLHHVTKNGGIHFLMGFLQKPRYAQHGISNHYWQYGWRPLPQCPSSTSRAYEKPYCIPCRNDGWHHISSTSAKIAQCKGIHPSSHQGSQRTCELQQLDAPEAKLPLAAGRTMCKERRRTNKRSVIHKWKLMSLKDYKSVSNVCQHIELCTIEFGIILGSQWIGSALDL